MGNLDKIQNYQGPVLIIHAEFDTSFLIRTARHCLTHASRTRPCSKFPAPTTTISFSTGLKPTWMRSESWLKRQNKMPADKPEKKPPAFMKAGGMKFHSAGLTEQPCQKSGTHPLQGYHPVRADWRHARLARRISFQAPTALREAAPGNGRFPGLACGSVLPVFTIHHRDQLL